MHRRLIAFLLAALLLLPYVPVYAAAEPQPTDIRLAVGGQLIDVDLLLLDGRTLVPLRAVAQALGAEVGWNGESRTVSLTLGDRQVRLPIGAMAAAVTTSGVSRSIPLEVPAMLVGGTTYVPTRFVAEGLGAPVTFDAATRTVLIGLSGSGGSAGGSGGQTGAAAAAWQRFDVTGDGRVDEKDTKLILASLSSPTLDVNGDGQKEIADSYALPLLLTKWDRNGDRVVSAADFTPLPPLTLPAPDSAAAARLVTSLYQAALPKVPADLESKLRTQWVGLNTADSKVLASLYEQAGAMALAQKNLEVAQWAFAKSFNLDSTREVALANLGFILAETGRHQEALLLLARARQMEPAACATSNNIGWVFARNGQNEEALRYYQEAVQACPEVGQYQLNLGVVLLRLGQDAAAARAFERAATQLPGDRDSVIMAVSTKPHQAPQMDEYRREWDRQREAARADAEANGEDTEWIDQEYRPWEELSELERADRVIQQTLERIEKDRDAALDGMAEEYRARLREITKSVSPDGKDACADYQKWEKNYTSATKQIQALMQEADHRASLLLMQAERRKGAELFALSPWIRQIVLKEAQAQMEGYSDPEDARAAFAETMEFYYDRFIQGAEELLNTPFVPEELDLEPELTNATGMVALAPWAILAGSGDPNYVANLDKCGTKSDVPEVQFSRVAGVSLGIVGFEWNMDDEEFKLQVGQGVIAAGTWSPTSGFGFQVGAGVDFTEGPFKASTAAYVKWGSDGSLSTQIEGGAGMDAMFGDIGFEGQRSMEWRAATHEPVMAWP